MAKSSAKALKAFGGKALRAFKKLFFEVKQMLCDGGGVACGLADSRDVETVFQYKPMGI
jgi:uncharacterized protein (DUF169 family)